MGVNSCTESLHWGGCAVWPSIGLCRQLRNEGLLLQSSHSQVSCLLPRHHVCYMRKGARLNENSHWGRNRMNCACAVWCQQCIFDQKKGETQRIMNVIQPPAKGLVTRGLSTCMLFRQKYRMPSCKDLLLKFSRKLTLPSSLEKYTFLNPLFFIIMVIFSQKTWVWSHS